VFLRAHQVCPDSVPYALNGATACRDAQDPHQEAELLQRALAADGMEGAELVMGAHLDRFWQRWQEALARGLASIDMLKAEAHIRVARLEAEQGCVDAATAELHEARRLDADNHGGAELLAEILWRQDRKEEAAQVLREHAWRTPFEFSGRKRLCEMLESMQRDDELDTWSSAVLRIMNACVEATDLDDPAAAGGRAL
jgi:hypothetical protein